jgi:Mg2+-importing ATPase
MKILNNFRPGQAPNIVERARTIAASPLLQEAATAPPDEVYRHCTTTPQGLSEQEAEHRRQQYGPNVVVQEAHYVRLKLLGKAIVNPLVILLLVLAVVSALADPGDNTGYRAAVVMLVMVVLGVVLRFVQEARADTAAAKLRTMIQVTTSVVRDGRAREVPLADLVPGDVVRLSAGDMVPADLRVVSCKDLFLIQASLTGESFPVEKTDAAVAAAGRSPLELPNLCFLGTSVESGSAQAVVVATGRNTFLGSMASVIARDPPPTSFDRGVANFTWLMLRFMAVMVPLVFFIVLTKQSLKDAFFFSLAVAVGLTPEMLPMIVTVCLSRGAMAMSSQRVIVKRLNAIQNLGAMDVLCTDKTGTLTMDKVILERYCNVVLEEDEDVLELAYLNSHFQTGLKNLLDRAILDHRDMQTHLNIPQYEKVDEVPFDFARKVMSVVVKLPDGTHRLICKGAPEEIFRRCTTYDLDGNVSPMEHVIIDDLREEYLELSADGFRVLALGYKDFPPKSAYGKDDERDLVLKGYVAFLDPPKDSATPAIAALKDHGVTVKVLTGDNELVSRKICHEVGIDADHFLLGHHVERMSDVELSEAVDRTILFARLSPAHKQRIIEVLQRKGHVVGFLGDGINDAPALRTADVGISVDTAVDIAKESADAILLEKSLMVLSNGVMEGRKVFVNILKYIRMGASSSFGNMFSVVGAAVWLPFLPMLPIQVLTNNLLYDFSQVPIPTDEVDAEQVARPQPWSIGQITRFILFIGPCSSVFDYTTFFLMVYVFGAWTNSELFQTGWFMESLLTQTLIIHVIRTNRIPFVQGRASSPLILTTLVVMAVGLWLPFSPIAAYLGFAPVEAWNGKLSLYGWLLAATVVLYIVLTQTVKTWLLRRGWL